MEESRKRGGQETRKGRTNAETKTRTETSRSRGGSKGGSNLKRTTSRIVEERVEGAAKGPVLLPVVGMASKCAGGGRALRETQRERSAVRGAAMATPSSKLGCPSLPGTPTTPSRFIRLFPYDPVVAGVKHATLRRSLGISCCARCPARQRRRMITAGQWSVPEVSGGAPGACRRSRLSSANRIPRHRPRPSDPLPVDVLIGLSSVCYLPPSTCRPEYCLSHQVARSLAGRA